MHLCPASGTGCGYLRLSRNLSRTFFLKSAVLSSVAPRHAGSRQSGCVKRGGGGTYDAEHVLFNVANLAQNHNRYYQICY